MDVLQVSDFICAYNKSEKKQSFQMGSSL